MQNLRSRAADAYLLFLDLCQMTTAETPHWLVGAPEIARPLVLELLTTALTACPDLFFRHPEYTHLLKERVCSLVIKLFSPTVKVRYIYCSLLFFVADCAVACARPGRGHRRL
jgi:hypothetical protein